MSLLSRIRREPATYWKLKGYLPDGTPEYESPKGIQVRWTNKKQMVTNAEGKEIQVMHKVFLPFSVNEDDLLYRGCIRDLPPENRADPHSFNGPLQVKATKDVPKIRYNEILYKAHL